jgi:stress response protein YsnF
MNQQPSVQKLESAQHTLRIKVLLEKLRSKLKNFSVMDKVGHLMGVVKDIHLDKSRQLNLVISEADAYSKPRFFLLRSSHIQNVDSPQKIILVDISKTEIDELPEYQPSQTPKADVAAQPVSSSIPETKKVESNIPEISASTSPRNGLEFQQEDEMLGDDSEPLDGVEDEVIRLLEERLVVDVKKHKMGEVIVRKEIETRMVQVPVRREILIVEQVGSERKQLAQIDLGQPEEAPAIELPQLPKEDSQPIVTGVFNSPRTASLLLDAIAKQRNHGCKQVRVEIVLENAEQQQTFQEWVNRVTQSS